MKESLIELPNQIEEEEYRKAGELVTGDVFFNDGDGWCTVVSNCLNSRSPYAKLSVIPEKDMERYRIERISGLYIKKPANAVVLCKTKEYLMSIQIISARKIASDIVSSLDDLAALEDAPQRLEVLPQVFVDKTQFLSTVKSELRVLHSKLGEMLKKV